MKSSTDLFTRSPHNPIITAAALPYPANSVFNPGAAQVDGQTVLLLRVEDRRGISHLTVARSADGYTDWTFDPEPSRGGRTTNETATVDPAREQETARHRTDPA